MKFYRILLLSLVLVMLLSACGERTKEEPVQSPSPSAQTTVIPTETATPGSVHESDANPGDVTNPDYSVMPGDENAGEKPDSAQESAGETESTQEEGSTAGDDLRRAGEDLEDAAKNTVHSVEDGLENMGR